MCLSQNTISELEIAKRKAAYIYGFTKYIRWENQDKLPVFSIGILGDEPHLVSALDEVAEKKKVGIAPNQKSIVIKTFRDIDEISGVQMLYADKRNGFDIEKILEKIKGTGTLLVSENYPYQSSMINFIQGGNLQKFEYDRDKITAENMKIATEIDEFAVSSYQDWLDIVKIRDVDLEKEKVVVERQSEKLSAQAKEIKIKESELKEKTAEIQEKNNELEIKTKEIAHQENKLKQLLEKSELQKKNLEERSEILKKQELEIMKQNAEIENQKNNLKHLRTEAENLEKQNKLKEETITEKEAVIETKQLQLYWIAGILLLIAAFGAFIFRQYKAKQRINKMLEEKNMAIQEQKELLEQQKKLVDIKNKNITASINYARRIQQAILISRERLGEIMPEHFIFYRPRDIVSGDFYWAHRSASGKLIFAAVDCTGHGVPGAFMSMVGSALLNKIVIENEVEDADEILNRMKKGVIQALKQTGASGEQKDGMDIALVSLEPGAGSPENQELPGTLKFAGANNPLYHFRHGILTEYKGNRQTIGYQKGKEDPFTKHSIEVQKGDAIYIFTDGYADQKGGPEGRKFYSRTLQDLFASIHHLPMAGQRTAIKKTFEEWKGNYEQIDDICVIGVRI